MASSLAPPRGADLKNSDTFSEISESGTGTSGWNSNWDTREDLIAFVEKIGLPDVSHLYQERLQVDRKKMEQMISGDDEALFPAEIFFETLMEETMTFITWPNKLKVGAKSKKDPHVRIVGRPEDVAVAKERLVAVLQPRCNRVTMKMDVSYTDHSHIIGKAGYTIKRVMEETKCHVHFPDSNRSNSSEKSNQVSISGHIDGVESARSRVRQLIPLIFGFELPIMSENFDTNTPYVIHVQEQYQVQVMFKTRPKLHATLVLVKGVEWNVEDAKQATTMLINYMCGKLADQTPVHMSMEISPHHHQIVLGKNHSNLKAIMQYTKCKIMFPDVGDPNIPNLKKSNVNISGNIHQVYKARQLLMGSLPLSIIFDLPENSPGVKITPEKIADVQKQCDVIVHIRQKTRQCTKACIIRGIEKYAGSIYKARNLIMGIEEPPINADVPMDYHLPSLNITPQPKSFSTSDLLPTPTPAVPEPQMGNFLSPFLTPSWQFANPPSTPTTPFLHLINPNNQSYFNFNVNPQSMGSSGFGSMNMMSSLSSNHYDHRSQDNSGMMHSKSPTNLMSSNSGISNFSPRPNRSFNENCSEKSELSSIVSEISMSANGSFQEQPMEENHERRNSTPAGLSKRLAGFRAMKNSVMAGELRIPNNSWSGYGISNTSPAPLNTNQAIDDDDDDVFESPQSTNSPMDPLYGVYSSKNWTDLPSIMTSLGLDRYISLMHQQEIDVDIFSTLTSKDLIKIGVNTFGARRKMLWAISVLKKRNSKFSAAPGAERKSSSNSSPRDKW